MKVFTSIESVQLNNKTIVAVGNFDGLHIGHMELIKTTVKEAREKGYLAACFTFSNHTRDVKFVCTEEEKLEILENAGIDVVFNVPFEEKIKNTSPEEFVEEILSVKLNAAGISCGFNYRFGKKAAGDVEFLRREAAKTGLEVYVHDAVTVDGEVVSSTAVRKYIDEGNMEKVNAFLGRYYTAKGTVVHGKKLGRVLGFPTANILFEEYRVAPPNGVYYTYAIVDGVRYGAITNIGHKPTIGEFAKSLETHIYKFDGDLYNKDIIVEFIHWARPEIKFDSIDALAEQVLSDKEDAYNYHFGKK